MNIVVKKLDETSITYEQIADLMHESFEERLQQGLKFTCSFMSVEQYKKKTADGVVFVAIDEDTQELMGTAVVHVKKADGVIYGYNELAAICSKAKRCGIGSMLLNARVELVKNAGGEYILSDTAVGAQSSIKYHLKNGFKIIGLTSFSSTNYYSYLFRKQLAPSKLWNNNLFCKLVFIKSYIYTKLISKEDGSKTWLRSIYHKLFRSK